jgi:hypothetical protein
MLVTWAGQESWALDLAEASYRVRYCAARMDEAYQADTRLDGEPKVDTYLLQFWPDPGAAAEPDRVIKQTSDIAGMWHGHASTPAVDRDLVEGPWTADRADEIDLRWFRCLFLLRLPESSGAGSP